MRNPFLPLVLATCGLVAILDAHAAAPPPAPALRMDLFPEHPALVPGVRIYRIATDRALHRFFDTSAMSPSGRYVAVFRFPQETRTPAPGEAGEVVLIDLQTGRERVVAQSRGYEVQLAANVQWGATDEELFFNDVDPSDWSAFAVKLNPLTGESRRMEGTVFMASADGRTLASYNLISSRRAQVGYGVVLPDDRLPPRNIGPVDTDGIDLTDTKTGKVQRIVTIRDIYERSLPSIAIPNPQEHEYYCFQVKWNPQGTRLLTTLQWSPRTGGPRRRTVITMRPDGSELRTAITADQWARGGHHINWAPDGEHLTMNLNVEGDAGLELIRVKADGSDLKVVFPVGSGHPSFNPTGSPFIITDAYPDEPVADRDGTSPLRLINVADQTEQTLVKIFVSMTGGEFRIDPHPVWDRAGRFVVFNGFVGNTRNVYLMDLGAVLPKP